jgi:hypothetical protein
MPRYFVAISSRMFSRDFWASRSAVSFHQERVGGDLPASSSALQQQVRQSAAFLETRGFPHQDAISAAYGHVYNQLQAQAHSSRSWIAFTSSAS